MIKSFVPRPILFGSRARGTHRADGDVDLAVLLPGTRERLTATSLAMADIADAVDRYLAGIG